MSRVHLLICKFVIVSSIALLASCDRGGDGGSSNNVSNINGSGSGSSGASISRFGSSNLDDANSRFSTDTPFVWDLSTFQ